MSKVRAYGRVIGGVIATMTTSDFVACRTLGHAWDPVPVPRSTAPPGGGNVWLWLRCTRCTTERHDEVATFTGMVDRRRYVYPDGYQRSGEEAVTRDVWRKEYLRFVSTPRRRRKGA